MAEPWERMKGETSRAFEAFAMYRDMGPSRSLVRAAAALEKGKDQIAQWSAQWKWVMRAEAWDDYLDSQKRIKMVEAQAAALERHDQLARAVLNKVAQRLVGDANTIALDPGKLTPQDIARLLDIGVKVQRLALAIPDPKVMLEIEGTVRVEEAADRLAASFEAYLEGRADGAADRDAAESSAG